MRKVTKAVKAFQGPLRPVAALNAHTARTTQTRQVHLGRRNEVWLRRPPSPPFVSLFILFILSPSSFHVLLPSRSVISLLAFFCAHNGPALSMYAHSLPLTQVSGRPGLDNEVSLRRNHTRTFVLSRPPFHVFISLFNMAHICALVCHLVTWPLTGRRVCETLGIIGLPAKLSFSAGGHRRLIELCPTKLSMVPSGSAA